MKRAVAYLRRSTDDKQADSLDIQRQEISAYASEHGYQVLQWYVDDGIDPAPFNESTWNGKFWVASQTGGQSCHEERSTVPR